MALPVELDSLLQGYARVNSVYCFLQRQGIPCTLAHLQATLCGEDVLQLLRQLVTIATEVRAREQPQSMSNSLHAYTHDADRCIRGILTVNLI